MRKSLSLLAAVLTGLGGLTVTSAGAAPAPPGSASRTVQLITGDQVAVRTVDGQELVDVVPATDKGIAGAMLHLRFGAKTFEVPATALPYLGRGLDLSLFDVHALLEGKAPVSSANRQVDAKSFGAALAKQYAEDRARGHFGGQGLFAGNTTFGLAGTGKAPAKPFSVMRTVSLGAVGVDGKPDSSGTAFLYNTDDANLVDPGESVNSFYDGTAKFSVPEGHYSALGLFFSTDNDNNVVGVRFVSQPEFTVKADMTVRVDAPRATSQVSWSTPRPALLDENGFFFRRAAKTGPGMVVDVDAGHGVPVWVAPTSQPVKTGELQTYPHSRLVSAPAPGLPYEYNLRKATSGVIPQQRYVVKPADIATVDASYYSELASVGRRQRAGVFSFQKELSGGGGYPMNLPRRQTEYVSADPALKYFGGLAKYTIVESGFEGWYGAQYEAFHGYRAGQKVTEDWNKFPLHPAGDVSVGAPDDPSSLAVPAATREGDLLRFSLSPFSDSQAGHRGMGYYGESRDSVFGQYQLTQDGVVVAEGSPQGIDFDLQQPVGAEASTLKLTLDANRYGPMYSLSTGSHTEWTWKSKHVEDATLPGGFACVIPKWGDPYRSCAVEPLLSLGYQIGGLATSGEVASGPQSLDLTVGHLQQSVASAITGATVQFSLDDGANWQDATTTARGDGVFRAAFAASTSEYRGAFVSLRVTATDASGGSIAETISRAYKINA